MMKLTPKKPVAPFTITEKLAQEKVRLIAPTNLPLSENATGRENATLTVGKVAQLAQVSADTVRYYEKEGLLNPTQKSAAGYRLYNEDAVRRLNFIKHAQHCGLSLAEIRELLELKSRDDSCCVDVRTVAVQKKLQLESKIRALKAMSNALTELIDVCTEEGKSLDECPILSALETSLNRPYH